jgi:phage tail sheath protein FI
MPEYLSPGVYVEEVDGAQSIEGVSTSTAGVVGVAERGPVDVTMLVTSFAEFRRTFGGYLDPARFPDLWYLPHAVEGFFQNGGKRLFVSRVAPDAAAAAKGRLYGAVSGAAAVTTALAATARPGDGVLVLEDPAGLANGDTIRLDTGGRSEYLRLAPANALLGGLAGNQRIRGLRVPLYRDCGKEEAVGVTMTEPTTTVHLKIARDVQAGVTAIPLDDTSNVNADMILRLGAAGDGEFVVVAGKPQDPADRRALLRHPIRRAYASGADAWVFVSTDVNQTKLSQPAAAGDGLIVVDDALMLASADAVRIGTGGARVYHRVVQPRAVRLRAPLAWGHPALEPVRELSDARDASNNLVYAANSSRPAALSRAV